MKYFIQTLLLSSISVFILGCGEEHKTVDYNSLVKHYTERWVDSNGNGKPDPDEEYFDQNKNGKYDEIKNYLTYEVDSTGKYVLNKKGQVQAFTGTAEARYDGGQLMYQDNYKDGKPHGLFMRWTPLGIKVYKKEFKNGLKNGTFMTWFTDPINPPAEKAAKFKELGLPTSWGDAQAMAREKAKKGEFPAHPSQESNDWVISSFGLIGGDFILEKLQYYVEDLENGEWELYEPNGSAISETEYDMGKLVEHKLKQ